MGAGIELSVIVPTLNERECLLRLDPPLRRAIAPYRAEILVVDDASTDGTPALVREWEPLGLYSLKERVGRRGLGSAIVEGFDATRGMVVLVLDADGSHDPASIPALVDPVLSGRAEFVLGSRNVPGGTAPGLSAFRRLMSWGAAVLARPLTPVRDPMSGFFAVARKVLGRARLRPVGYKVGLEVLVKCRPTPVLEVPIHFAPRAAGESKLGGVQVGGYADHLVRLYGWLLLHRARGGPPRPAA